MIKMMKDLNEVKKFIVESKYLCLGVCDMEGNAWTCPLTYVADGKLNIYFHSALDSTHIEAIRENPYVSFSIYDSASPLGEVDGIQGKAIVGQLDAEDVGFVHDMFFKKHIPDDAIRKMYAPPAAAFLSDAFPQKRFFKMQILEAYKKDLELPMVFRRQKIELDDLIN